MSIPCVTRTDVRTVVRHLASVYLPIFSRPILLDMLKTEPHEDSTGRCSPYCIWPEQGRQTEERVRPALPHGHGRLRAPRLRSCTASASASTPATAPTFSPPFLVRPGGGGCGTNRLMGRRAEVPIIRAQAQGESPPWDIELDHGAAMSAEDEISDNRRGHRACAAHKAAWIGCFPTHWLQVLL
ncbi:hypothetical protein EDB86DRAFT_1064328 [Lactarius hatsudake]|nr:hypothetical protein EDB86DRAFT_1064328 [Lactarius hatsudake]